MSKYDVNDFTSTETIDGWASRKTRTFGPAMQYIQDVAKNGRPHDSLSLIGWWRPHEAGEKNAPVYVPWFVFDVDRSKQSLGTAYDDTVKLLMRCEDFGLDLERIYASFSGRRGFHVHIESSMFGNPIFPDRIHAKKAIKEIMQGIAGDIEVDSCVWNPLSAIRLTGATHAKSKGRKFTLGAYDFLTQQAELQGYIDTALEGAMPFEWEWPDPVAGDPIPTVQQRMVEAWKGAMQKNENAEQDANKRNKIGAKHDRAIMPYSVFKAWQGVQKSSQFAFGKQGRDNAAFLLACHFIRSGKSPKQTLEILRKWDRRNVPPLQDDVGEPVDVLEQKVNSACERLYEDGQVKTLQQL